MLDPVPRANQIRNKTPSFNSAQIYGATENDAISHKMKAKTTDTVTAYFHVNFLYAGFAQFTMLVITVAQHTRIRVVVAMIYKL
jgi:hypothetical protein